MLKLNTTPVKSYLSPSKITGVDFVINPYCGCPHKCLYCYAEYMRKFSAHSEPWGHFLDVKMCAAPLPPAKIFHRHILLSSVTDPYNIFEKKYEVTRKLLLQLVEAQAYVGIITKSDLVVRDIDLLSRLPVCEVALSFSTPDETLARTLEPFAPPVSQRIEALRQLHQAGIPTIVMGAPLLPELSDWKTLIEKTAPFTDLYRFDRLNLNIPSRQRMLDFIDARYPHLLPLYSRIYTQEDPTYYQNLAQQIRTYCTARQLKSEIFFA